MRQSLTHSHSFCLSLFACLTLTSVAILSVMSCYFIVSLNRQFFLYFSTVQVIIFYSIILYSVIASFNSNLEDLFCICIMLLVTFLISQSYCKFLLCLGYYAVTYFFSIFKPLFQLYFFPCHQISYFLYIYQQSSTPNIYCLCY